MSKSDIEAFKRRVEESQRTKYFVKPFITDTIDKLAPVIDKMVFNCKPSGTTIVTKGGHHVFISHHYIGPMEGDDLVEKYSVQITPLFNKGNKSREHKVKIDGFNLCVATRGTGILEDKEAVLIIDALDGEIRGDHIEFKCSHETVAESALSHSL